MSKFSVLAAAAAGAVLALLHVQSKATPADTLKSAAQKELDQFKPQAILLVQQTAQKAEGQALTHANALDLQTQIVTAIDKKSLPDLAKTGLKLAVISGITEANVDALAGKGVATVETLSTLLQQKIIAARL